MTTFTVTATQGGGAAAANGMTTVLKVVTGAGGTQPGATGGTTGATPSAPVTPQANGSWVYGAALVTSNLLSPLAGTTNESYTTASGLSGIALRSTSVTTSGSPVTYGESGTTHGISVALAEILAAGTLAEDASSPPAVVFANVKTQTTNAFTPPPGSLLVLMVATNGNAGVVTLSVTDTSGLGLTWVQQSVQNVTSSGYSGAWTAQMPSGGPPSAPPPIPPGIISPASVRFTWRPARPGATNVTTSFTGAVAGPGAGRGVIVGPQLKYYAELPGPVFKPLSFASPNFRVPLAAPAAAAGEAASTTGRQDPVTGRAAVSGVFASTKTSRTSVTGPSAASGLANGFNLGAGGVAGPAAASGTAHGVKVATGSFAGPVADSGAALGSPPVTGSFTGPAAVSALLPGGPPVPPPVLAAAPQVLAAPANPVTVTASSLTRPREQAFLLYPEPVVL